MLTHLTVDLYVLPDQLNLSMGILNKSGKTLLDALHLLRYSTKDTLLKTIKLIETPPSSNLTKPDENTTHSLEIESFIATKHQHKPPKLNSQSLYRFRFP